MNNVDFLKIRMAATAVSGWNFLLQKGFFLHGVSGMSVRELLQNALGYADTFIDETVRTIFRNNRPVDDIDTVFVHDGDRFALGGAMPGIVGIVMGRDNPYKSFRSDISVHKDRKERTAIPVTVSMKIFSTLAVETAVDVLGRGIVVEPVILADFLDGKESMIVEGGGMTGWDFLARLRAMDDPVGIQVFFE
ncbi:hypothetical protein GO013_11365 [Pseudodesulfovibrio sp. JC047]|uniref:hypothetical protein n=1 Tax=Pseudodesulfovibrio sp. JC047 TaxID=2683199 RepID=UPI0013D339BD|nr:hypothetical protein [Pseudodesulfovibrio sp. JC047]NDV20020.1 hypothetical protein [Pseudodesulfovibrio sp. JC047]